MKILHLVHNYYPSIGGSQNLFQNISEELVRTYNDDVSVFTTNAMFSAHASYNQIIPTRYETHNGVKITRFPFNRTFSKCFQASLRAFKKIGLRMPFRSYLGLLNAGPISLKMYRAISNSDADLIASTPVYYLNSFYPILSRKLQNKPFVIFGSLHITQKPIKKHVMSLIKKADAYVAHTAFEKDHLQQKGIDPEKIHVFGIGVDVEALQTGDGKKIREQYNIDNSPIVLFLGRQAPYKGIDTLIRAMHMVWSTNPEAFLIIAGSTTPYTKTIEKMISDLSETEREHVILIESLSETKKADLYNAANIFTMVSAQESFGIVYLEAWACKKPVIGGDIGAVQSLINDGNDGLLVEIGNATELHEKIQYLLNNPAEMERMGTAGYSRVITDFTWSSIAAKVHNLYQSLVDR